MPNRKKINCLKKLLFAGLVLTALLSSLWADTTAQAENAPTFAATAAQTDTMLSVNTAAQTENPSAPNALYARYAVLMDGDSGRVLFGKNELEQVPMASTTKIMTCILALEYGSPDLSCTTSKYAASMPDVQLNATTGEIFTLNDLLYSLMLKSHNDTAVIIAENVAYHYICNTQNGTLPDSFHILDNTELSFIPQGAFDSSFLASLSTEDSRRLVAVFADMMNQKAQALGCGSTHFITPNGLDASDENGIHSTTAKDLATIMSYCIKNEDFLTITQAASHSFSSHKVNGSGKSYAVSNANAFLHMYDNIISGKTGFTADAGYCYVCAYQCDGRTFVVALLACGWPNNKTYKWHDAKLLLNWGRAHYFPKEVITENFTLKDIRVENGLSDHTGAYINDHLSLLLSDTDLVNVVVNVPEYLNAPVAADSPVGDVSVYINDALFTTFPVYARDNVSQTTYFYFLRRVLNRLLFMQ